MWVGEVHNRDGSLMTIYIRGPICLVNRDKNSDFPFFVDDKTISRKHAEIHIKSDNDGRLCLYVVDLGSKFNTFIGPEFNKAINPNEMVEIYDQQEVRFGTGSSVIKFSRWCLSFCLTGLNKQEKLNLKVLATKIGAKVTEDPTEASHIVLNSLAVTLKSLMAIVLNKPLVTTKWLQSFTENDKQSCIIPCISDFKPGGDLLIVDPEASRINLLQYFTIFLQITDKAYHQLLTMIGANVILFDKNDYPDETKMKSLIVKHISDKDIKYICLFKDQSGNEKNYLEECNNFSTVIRKKKHNVTLYWITSGQIATSIFNYNNLGVSTSDSLTLSQDFDKLNDNDDEYQMIAVQESYAHSEDDLIESVQRNEFESVDCTKLMLKDDVIVPVNKEISPSTITNKRKNTNHSDKNVEKISKPNVVVNSDDNSNFETKRQILSVKNNKIRDDDDDGWISLDLKSKSKNNGADSMNVENLEFRAPASTVYRELQVPVVIKNGNKDQKAFRKNIVREIPQELIVKKKDMYVVSARESERSTQLRLEIERKQEEDMILETVFFDKKAKKKS